MAYQFETECIQAGYRPKNGEPRVLPICESTTYKYDDAASVGDLFDLKTDGHMYSRISNPTVAAVEAKVAALEGGVGAVLTSSGQAANLIAVLNITSVGQNIVAMSSVYGGTINLFAVTMKRFGIEVRFVTPEMSDEEVEARIDGNTRLFFGETIANPALVVFDIERYVALAHRHGIPVVVDNTFATPYLCRPFEWGVDIVTHSTTKYMDGHAEIVGGAVVDSGRFDWEKDGKYPELSTPDDSYHGVTYTKQFGKAAYITKARVQLVRDLGCLMTPVTAFQLNTSLESLPVRMERHCSNALAVAEFLRNSDMVTFVSYPGLASDPQHALAEKYLPRGTSGVISFGVRGGRRAAMKFMDSLKLAAIVVHVADARTCVLHPASTTHRQLTDEQLTAAGVLPEQVRLSVGLENIQDILADVEQALDAARSEL